MTFPFARISNMSRPSRNSAGRHHLDGDAAGAGARCDPPIWLKPGDRVEVEVEGLGRLVNGIRDE